MSGWQGWPPDVRQLAILARGIAQLDQAAQQDGGHMTEVDPDGLRAVVELLRREERE